MKYYRTSYKIPFIKMLIVVGVLPLMWAEQATAQISCSKYFNEASISTYSRQQALRESPSTLKDLRAQQDLAKKISFEELYEAYRTEEFEHIQPDVLRNQELIERLEQKLVAVRVRKIDFFKRKQARQQRVETLRKRYKILLKAAISLKTFNRKEFLNKMQSLKKITQQIKIQIEQVRSHQQIVKNLNTVIAAAVPQIQSALDSRENEIYRLMLNAELIAGNRASEQLQKVDSLRSEAQREAVQVIAEFASQWTLLNFDLASRAEAQKTLLESTVETHGQAVVLGERIAEQMKIVETATLRSYDLQREAQSASLNRGSMEVDFDFKKIITLMKKHKGSVAKLIDPHNTQIDLFESDVLKIERELLSEIEEQILDDVHALALNRENAYGMIQAIFHSTQAFFKMTRQIYTDHSKIKNESIPVNHEVNLETLSKAEDVVAHLLVKIEQINSGVSSSLASYYNLGRLVTDASLQMYQLTSTLQKAKADFARLLDTENLQREERQQVELLLRSEFTAP